jgi:hypothetical protein
MIRLPPNFRDMPPDTRDKVLQRIISDLELELNALKALITPGVSEQYVEDAINTSITTDYIVDELGNLMIDEIGNLMVME